jgi:hypothetical protein
METIIKYKRGDVREDGKVFWKYESSCKDGEYWLSKEKFEKKKKRESERLAKYYSKNANVFREYKKDRYAKNKITIREQLRVSRLKNIDRYREKGREISRLWRKKNPTKYKENLENWIKKNPDRYKLITTKGNSKRRAAEKNNTPDLTHNQKLIIETIYLQRIRLEKRFGIQFHVDHVIPISKGGLHIPSNLQVLPAKLNLKKNSKNSLRWEELQLI